jgi:multidrug transporter EmrE-like cation transporter
MIAYRFAAACIVLTGAGQLLLKLGATGKKGSGNIYLNAYSAAGYLMILSVTVFTVLALRSIDLKVLYALMALNYILLLALSRVILHEPITVNKLAATLLIFAGVIVFNL